MKSTRPVSKKFKENFLRIAGANISAQLILLISLPLLTRLYTPKAFGLAALFLACLQLLGSFSSWRLERSIPNRRTLSAAAAQLVSAVVVISVFCMFTFLQTAAAPSYIYLWSGAEQLGTLIVLLPIAVFGLCCNQVMLSWYVRVGDLKRVSHARMVQTISYILVAFSSAYLGFNQSGLVFAIVISWLASLVAMMYGASLFYKYVFFQVRKRTFLMTRLVLRESTWATLVQVLNTVSLAAPVILLAQQFSTADVGLYGLVVRLLVTPLTVITGALALSFWAHAAELVRNSNRALLKAHYLKATLALLFPSLAMVVVCYFSGDFIVLFLGSDWSGADKILMAVLPMACGILLFAPTNHLIVLGYERLQLIADGVRLLLILLSAFVIWIASVEFNVAVFMIAVSSLVGHIILFMMNILAHSKVSNRVTFDKLPDK